MVGANEGSWGEQHIRGDAVGGAWPLSYAVSVVMSSPSTPYNHYRLYTLIVLVQEFYCSCAWSC